MAGQIGRIAATLAVLAALMVPAAAAEIRLEQASPVPVVRLQDDRELSLAGIVPGSGAAEAIAGWLAAGGFEVRPGERRDRYGRRFGDLERGGESLARFLVASGLAAVDPGESALDLPALLETERQARAARRGLWRDDAFGPFPAEQVLADPPRFILVEGLVVRAARTTIYWYANFGERLREDFTFRVPVTAGKAFEAAGIDLAGLGEHRVRVRGWLFEDNGPMIEITHPLALEILR